MISFNQYHNILSKLSQNGIHSQPVKSLVNKQGDLHVLVIKHDVEANLKAALRAAQIETELGHCATYYLQGDLLQEEGSAEIVNKIAQLGHEVSYHYDVLDSCDGDFPLASEEFEHYKSLIESASGQAIETVCPHGNPTKVRNGWKSNKDFFRSPSVRQKYSELSDIVVDFNTLMPNGTYISDAGFRLRKIGNISGNDQSNANAIDDGVDVAWDTLETMSLMDKSILLSLHTHRMRDSEFILFLTKKRIALLRSGYKLGSKVPGVKWLANKFYAYSRRL
ncbi:hypothetical protein [Fretibacter rubidus]|uniref:hypothetical protein n=1 Tax=Fretibacter rubidus TaxID=570162 RepID=UPI00352A5735